MDEQVLDIFFMFNTYPQIFFNSIRSTRDREGHSDMWRLCSYHRKLTQEELERHEKETKLSEVDGRALQAEEELGCLRQKVKDMQEEMQQNERSLKAEVRTLPALNVPII